jgi:DNA helicase-2/ATP-dependent DNA helicase PcrA
VRVLEAGLDDEQRTIALASDESLLVVAGPGSGKTRLLTHVAAYHARRSAPSPWRVLCLTFSVEAARQMRDRLDNPDLQLPSARRVEVANFHQFGLRLLGHHGHHVGWPRDAQVLDILEAQDIARDVAVDLGLPGLSGRNAHDAISRLRNNRDTSESGVEEGSLARLRAAYEARLDDMRVRDFDDLVLDAIDLLDRVPAVADIVRTTYRYILVDELQDTSGWQLEFVDRLSGHGATTIFAVADNDQMIYEWRDARAENVTEWEERFAARRVSLLGNYRCPPRIVEAANSLITHNREVDADPLDLPYSRVTDRTGEIVVRSAHDEPDEGRVVAEIVAGRLSAGVDPGSIAVLASVGFLLEPSIEALGQSGIQVVRVGDDPTQSTAYVRALRAALVVSSTPGHERARHRLVGLLAAAVQPAEIDATVAGLLQAASVDALAIALAQCVGLSLDDEVVVRSRQIMALAQRESGADQPGEVGRRIALEWSRMSRRLQQEAGAVKAMTTFAAKGLEFNTVIMPGFNRGLVPYVRQGTNQTERWWAEERRKMYVAVTRTQSTLALVVRDGRPPSPFAEELGIA